MFTFRAPYGEQALCLYYSADYYLSCTLQDSGEPIFEADLEIFCSWYAPSARTGYTFARQDRLSSYEDSITISIGKLTFDKVAAMLSAAERLGPTDVSRHILVSLQSDRKKHMITIATRYLFIKLRDHLHIRTLPEAAKLYQVFVRNLYTKASADYTFEDVHDLFCNGGMACDSRVITVLSVHLCKFCRSGFS